MTEDIDEIEGNWYNSFNKINRNLTPSVLNSEALSL